MKCQASVTLDFDPISCGLPEGHRGPHRDTGVGNDVLWLPTVAGNPDPTADPYQPDEARDAIGQALWDATRSQSPDEFMPTVMTDLGSALRVADWLIATLPALGWEITRTGRGRWLYGAVLSEPDEALEIASSASAWHYEPYETIEECKRDWPGREIVRAWKRDLGEWEPVP